MGRGRDADLYYTGFALRSLAVLGAGAPAVWSRAAGYVRAQRTAPTDPIDCFSLLHAKHLARAHGGEAWSVADERQCVEHCHEVLAAHEATGGGWARQPGAAASLYSTFLASLCMQSTGRPAPDAVAVVQARQCPDGGFSDLGESGRGETNPTAAAVALLQLAGALDACGPQGTTEFLLSMQREDGGFAAHASAPVTDLLSTFTQRQKGAGVSSRDDALL